MADRVDHILHAGDVGDPLILDKLRWIAPLTRCAATWTSRRLPASARQRCGELGGGTSTWCIPSTTST